MMRRTGRFSGWGELQQCDCGCDAPGAPAGLGGFFSTILDAAGAFVGDPGLGNQIAAGASPGWGKLSETPAQIAQRIAPDVGAAIAAGKPIAAAGISPQAQQIAAGVASDVAATLAAQGVTLAAGTVGGELQHPSTLDAFGGANRTWVLIGGAALAGLLLFKEL
jgi:hypothetical protein